MPRTRPLTQKLRDEEQEKLENAQIISTIKQYMAKAGVDNWYELAEKIGIRRETLSSKKHNPWTFKQVELKRICRVLKIPSEVAIVFLGYGGAA